MCYGLIETIFQKKLTRFFFSVVDFLPRTLKLPSKFNYYESSQFIKTKSN